LDPRRGCRPWLGVVLFAAGGELRILPVFVLGNRLSGLVAIQPGHTLVTGGVYGVVRNPSYLGLLVGSLGWALAFRSGVGPLLTALLIPPIIARIHAEENLLRSHFGGEYDAYCARTRWLIPESTEEDGRTLPTRERRGRRLERPPVSGCRHSAVPSGLDAGISSVRVERHDACRVDRLPIDSHRLVQVSGRARLSKAADAERIGLSSDHASDPCQR